MCISPCQSIKFFTLKATVGILKVVHLHGRVFAHVNLIDVLQPGIDIGVVCHPLAAALEEDGIAGIVTDDGGVQPQVHFSESAAIARMSGATFTQSMRDVTLEESVIASMHV